jgi:nucleotide-binding universal stress UspA family protein
MVVDSVVIPVDGSRHADDAVRIGHQIAAALDVPVQLLTVVPDLDAVPGALACLRREALSSGGTADVQVAVDASPAHGITTWLTDRPGALACMASHAPGLIGSLLEHRSIVLDVLRSLRRPIVAVGPSVDRFAPDKGVVTCVDGSGLTPAMQWAIELAGAIGGGMDVLTVAEPVPPSVRHPGEFSRRFGPHGDAATYVRTLADEVEGVEPVRPVVVYDPISVAEGVLTHVRARRPSLVAVATPGGTGLHRLDHGRVARVLLQRSPVPVLLTPHAA